MAVEEKMLDSNEMAKVKRAILEVSVTMLNNGEQIIPRGTWEEPDTIENLSKRTGLVLTKKDIDDALNALVSEEKLKTVPSQIENGKLSEGGFTVS